VTDCAAALRVLRRLEWHGVSVTWDGDGVAFHPPQPVPDGVLEALAAMMRPFADGRSRLDLAHERHDSLLQAVKGAAPSDATDAQWKTAIEGLRIFLLSGWGAAAEAAGWTPSELYAVPPVWSRVDLCGVGLLIGDSEIVEITPTRIQIKTAGGALQSFYRAPTIDYRLVFRSRLKQIEGNYSGDSDEPRLRAIEWTVAEYRRNTGADLGAATVAVQTVLREAKQ
jgi:hypothetical protein